MSWALATARRSRLCAFLRTITERDHGGPSASSSTRGSVHRYIPVFYLLPQLRDSHLSWPSPAILHPPPSVISHRVISLRRHGLLSGIEEIITQETMGPEQTCGVHRATAIAVYYSTTGISNFDMAGSDGWTTAPLSHYNGRAKSKLGVCTTDTRPRSTQPDQASNAMYNRWQIPVLSCRPWE